MQLADQVALYAASRPDAVALIDLATGRRWRYRDLESAIDAWAHVLESHAGVGGGDRVACVARNSACVILVHLACSRLGAILAPLNWRLSADQLQAIIADAAPALVIGDEVMTDHGIGGMDLGRLASMAEAANGNCAGAREACGTRGAEPPALLLYTSGTCGQPKGALLSERALDAAAAHFLNHYRLDAGTVFLVDMPLYHTIGLVASSRSTLMAGGTVLISPGFDAERTAGYLVEPKLCVTHYFAVPAMVRRIRLTLGSGLAELQHLAAVFVGGAPLPLDELGRWTDAGVTLVNGYGLTEAGTVLGMPDDPQAICSKTGSLGVAVEGVEVCLVAADGKPVAGSNAGELRVRSAALMSGYWRRPDATDRSLCAEGWLATGDVVRRDGDGYYWYAGRVDDMYISGGENIHPVEVEAVAARYPGVAECAAVGVPDETWGAVGALFVVTEVGATLDAAGLRAHLERHLPRFKVPRHIRGISSLPATATGKIQRRRLAEQWPVLQ